VPALAGVTKSRTPSGEAPVASATLRKAMLQAPAGSAAGFSLRPMVPKNPHSVFRVGRIVMVIVGLRARLHRIVAGTFALPARLINSIST
jgi:hypothetical protein